MFEKNVKPQTNNLMILFQRKQEGHVTPPPTPSQKE